MNTLRDVKADVRTLVEDPDGTFATDADIIQKTNLVYRDVVNYLANFSSPFLEKLIPVLNVPAGTTDFTQYQVTQNISNRAGQEGAPLTGLVNPLRIEWKQAGTPENQYRDVRFVSEDLPHVVPGNYINGQSVYWTWRAWKIYITPLGYPADFLVTGEFRPAPLLKDEDIIEIHPLISSYLAYAVAAMIGASRVNASYIQTWTQMADSTRDDVAAWLVRKDQGGIVRFGRITGGRRSRY